MKTMINYIYREVSQGNDCRCGKCKQKFSVRVEQKPRLVDSRQRWLLRDNLRQLKEPGLSWFCFRSASVSSLHEGITMEKVLVPKNALTPNIGQIFFISSSFKMYRLFKNYTFMYLYKFQIMCFVLTVLKRDDFAPLHAFGNIQSRYYLSQQQEQGAVASSACRPGVMLKCAEQCSQQRTFQLRRQLMPAMRNADLIENIQASRLSNCISQKGLTFFLFLMYIHAHNSFLLWFWHMFNQNETWKYRILHSSLLLFQYYFALNLNL